MNCKDAVRQKNLAHYGFGTELMKTIKVCAACGTRADARQLFCKECGAALPKETLHDTYRRQNCTCRVCGTVVKSSTAFCPKCGARIEKGKDPETV